MFRLVFLMVVLVLAGCTNVRPAFEQTIVETEYHKDTVLIVKSDTSLVRAWLYCDSLFNVNIGELVAREGEILKLNILLDSIEGSQIKILEVTTVMPAMVDTISWIERETTTDNITTQIVEVVIYKPPWWMKFVIVVESILLIFFVFLIIKISFDTR